MSKQHAQDGNVCSANIWCMCSAMCQHKLFFGGLAQRKKRIYLETVLLFLREIRGRSKKSFPFVWTFSAEMMRRKGVVWKMSRFSSVFWNFKYRNLYKTPFNSKNYEFHEKTSTEQPSVHINLPLCNNTVSTEKGSHQHSLKKAKRQNQ